MTYKTVQVVYSDNPKVWAQALVACLGADKGISATMKENGPGAYRVMAEGKSVVVMQRKPQALCPEIMAKATWTQ